MSFEVDIEYEEESNPLRQLHSTMKANEIYVKHILDQINGLKLIETLKLEMKKPKNKGETLNESCIDERWRK